MSLNVAVLDYGMGNLRSVAKALEAAGAKVSVTEDPLRASGSDALCVPGQGIFGRCMDNLAASGADDLIRDWISSGRPYLGICLGLQILFESSEEGGGRHGLRLFPGEATRLPARVTVPHIGWNTVAPRNAGQVAPEPGNYYYFDHSYAVQPADENVVSGWCSHGMTFAAAVETEAVTAVQFHPEKSGAAGIALLESWVRAA